MISDTGTCTQLWLVTEYLPNGSLYDYLEINTLNEQLAMQFVRSITHGLSYLHTEVPGVSNQCRKSRGGTILKCLSYFSVNFYHRF